MDRIREEGGWLAEDDVQADEPQDMQVEWDVGNPRTGGGSQM